MRTKFAAALAAITLSAGMAAGVTMVAATPAMAASKFSVETTPIADLLTDAKAKAVVLKYLPGLEENPYFEQVKPMTLRALSAYPQAGLDDAKLKSMQEELDAAAM